LISAIFIQQCRRAAFPLAHRFILHMRWMVRHFIGFQQILLSWLYG